MSPGQFIAAQSLLPLSPNLSFIGTIQVRRIRFQSLTVQRLPLIPVIDRLFWSESTNCPITAVAAAAAAIIRSA
jgi:hypothetical protein